MLLYPLRPVVRSLPLSGLLALAACGGNGGPAAPTPPQPTTLTLAGQVRDAADHSFIAAVRVEVLDGANTGRLTMTGGDGRYVLTGLSAGTFRLQFSRDGYADVLRTVTLASDATMDVVLEGQADQRFTLSGHVRTPWNEPLDDVGVEVYHGGRVIGGGTTDRSGFYSIPTLPPREYLVRPKKWGYEDLELPVHVTADTRLDIVIDRGRVVIEGTVEIAPPCVARGVPGARVEVLNGPDAGRFSVTSPDGVSSYRLPDIAWGTFVLRASKPGYAASDASMNIPAPGGVVVREFIRLAGTAGVFTLSGNVRGGTAAIDGARFEVVSGPNAGRSTTSALGHYEMRELIPGEFRVRVSMPGFAVYENSNPICGDERRDVQLTDG